MTVRPLTDKISQIKEQERSDAWQKRVEDLEFLVNHLLERKKTVERHYTDLKAKYLRLEEKYLRLEQYLRRIPKE